MINRLKWLSFAVLIFTASMPVLGKHLPVETGWAEFRHSDTASVFEFYYSMPDTFLTYREKGGKPSAEILFNVKFIKNDSLIEDSRWIVDYSRDSIKSQNKNIFGQKNYLLPNGNFDIYIAVIDLLDTNSRFDKFSKIERHDFPNNRVCMSDIELANFIETTDKAGKNLNKAFIKNSLYVIPEPSASFYGIEPSIKTYAEIYNARTISPAGIIVEYRLLNVTKHEVLKYRKMKQSLSDGIVETENIPIPSLPTGLYYLDLKVVYPQDKPKDSLITERRVFVLNPDIPPEKNEFYVESQTFETSEFAPLTEEQVQFEWERSKIIATNYEKDLFEKCTSTDAKRHFMFSFWKKRNTDTLGVINSTREKYLQLAAHADKFFSFGISKDGWRTDRGRVLLKYGEPTQKEYHAAEGVKRQYEEWFYAEIQGGIHFYFVDMGNNGNFILVNSNMPGEVQNDNWYNLYVIPQNSNANEDYQNNR